MQKLERLLDEANFESREPLSLNPQYDKICDIWKRVADGREGNSYRITKIPILLELLTEVELDYRDKNLRDIREHFPHMRTTEEVVVQSGLLPPNLEEELSQKTHDLEGGRDMFWTIVTHCVRIHLLYLSEAASLSDFWCQFNEYLPFLFKDPESTPDSDTFHFGMNEAEKEKLADAAASALATITQTRGPKKKARKVERSLRPDAETLVDLFECYLTTVEEHIKLLNKAMDFTHQGS